MSASGSAERGALAAPRRPHIVLLGLPGAGKSTVGPLVASALGRPFVDLDEAIERRAGVSVGALFASEGETGFRARERALTAELAALGAEPIVLAPGGGWVEDPAHRAGFGSRFLAIHLAVSPTVALGRMGQAVATRPLLGGADPEARLEEILRRRAAWYLQSQYTVSTDSMTPAEVAASIVALASG